MKMGRKLFLVVMMFAVVLQGFIVYFIHHQPDSLNPQLYANTVGAYNAIACTIMIGFAVTSVILVYERSSFGFAIMALFCLVAGVVLGDYRAPWEVALVWVGLPASIALAIAMKLYESYLDYRFRIGAY
jgi:hypothetical protein